MTTAENFEGHEGRECGEHRTCGYRAWCFDCSEWCSQEAPCVRCEIPELRADLLAALDVIARLTEGWDLHHTNRAEIEANYWHRDPDEDEPMGEEPMSDREWRVFCHAAQRATRGGT